MQALTEKMLTIISGWPLFEMIFATMTVVGLILGLSVWRVDFALAHAKGVYSYNPTRKSRH